MNWHYSMQIRWSDADQAFIVSLAEFGPYANTHGETYEKAVRMGQEVLALLVESYKALGRPLPEPARYEGVEYKDEEDYTLERDKAFWQMIEERRKQKTIPIAEVKRRLGVTARSRAKPAARPKKS